MFLKVKILEINRGFIYMTFEFQDYWYVVR